MADSSTRVPRLDYLRQFCEACEMTKSHRTNTNTAAQQRAVSRLELVHSDIFGPLPVRSRTGHRDAIIFVDDSTRMRWIYFIRSTTEVLGCLKQFFVDAKVTSRLWTRVQTPKFPCRMSGKRERAGIFSAVYAVNEWRG
ncbi:unnamed protein product [Phaeothamnion confervicola]